MLQGALSTCTPCAWRRLQRALLCPRALPTAGVAAAERSASVPRGAAARADLFSLRPLERYPYPLVRRAKARRAWRPGVPKQLPLPPEAPPEEPPEREAAEALAADTPGGVYGLMNVVRQCSRAGEHAHAYRAALLVEAAASGNAEVLQAAVAAQRDAQAGLLVDAWASGVAAAAAREDAYAARVVARLAVVTPRRRDGSTPKPRQGYTKPLMRLLRVRLCCACRALAPRELMWRVMQLRTAQPGAPPKPQPRRRKIHRRWVYARRPAASAPAAAEEVGTAAAAQTPHARRPGSADAEDDRVERERPVRGGRVVLQRQPSAASEALQADDALWSPPTRGVRSVYVCRRLVCVQAAVKRKMLPRGLGAQVPPDLLRALTAAAQAEADAAAAAPPGTPPPGISAERAAQLAALVPQLEPKPPQEQKGPHDRWDAPPTAPRA